MNVASPVIIRISGQRHCRMSRSEGHTIMYPWRITEFEGLWQNESSRCGHVLTNDMKSIDNCLSYPTSVVEGTSGKFISMRESLIF